MKKLLLAIFILFPCCWSSRLFAQQTQISGSVADVDTKAAIVGASIISKGKLTGTTSGADGSFSLSITAPFPVTLVVSVVGYQKQEVEISSDAPVSISLSSKAILMDEMVFSASLVEESMLQSRVSFIEKLDAKPIRVTPCVNFYKGLQNLKGVEMVTSGLTYRQINTRGFNDTGNARFVQLVDQLLN